jgi:uncharacterized protein YyaL (SSP411 family)
MSYDNSQLARVYLHAWQVTGNEFFRTITEEILDYVVQEMTDPAGGFYSTQDADSEGEEGRFFLWTPNEIQDVLGDDPSFEGVGAGEFISAYGVTSAGNFEGKNILQFVGNLDQRKILTEARRKLFETREERVHPDRDDKVLTAWNGLMLAAFAEAARVLERKDYREIAERNADFLLHELRDESGRLLRTWKACPEGAEGAGDAKLNGYLEDYGYLIEGLLELYQTTFHPRWYQAAQELAELLIERFRAPGGGFFDTSDDHETLITRPRDVQDNATPSGSAMAATTLLKLGGLAVEPRYGAVAHEALIQMQSLMAQYPLGFGQWLQALSYYLSQPREIAILGSPDADGTRSLIKIAADGYRPNQLVALGDPATEKPAIPLLHDRSQIGGRATAYVCVDFACQAPVTDPQALRAMLEQT